MSRMGRSRSGLDLSGSKGGVGWCIRSDCWQLLTVHPGSTCAGGISPLRSVAWKRPVPYSIKEDNLEGKRNLATQLSVAWQHPQSSSSSSRNGHSHRRTQETSSSQAAILCSSLVDEESGLPFIHPNDPVAKSAFCCEKLELEYQNRWGMNESVPPTSTSYPPQKKRNNIGKIGRWWDTRSTDLVGN